MLKKKFRLQSFSLSSPTQVSAGFFSFKFTKNGLSENRYAFVVSKKVDKRAVVRNSLKRKTRAAFESMLDQIQNGYDFIVYPKIQTKDVTSAQVEIELKSTLSKNGLLKNEKN